MKRIAIAISVVFLVFAVVILVMSFPTGEMGESRPVVFTNTTRPAGQTVIPAGVLAVHPGEVLKSTGIVGGPFTPASTGYTLTNTGGAALDWTASNTQGWITLSPVLRGTLAPGASVTVTVSINGSANGLPPNKYTDTVTFKNTTNGNGNTTRQVTLTVTPPAGGLSVTPPDGLISTGTVGGPFNPAKIVYTLQNPGGTPINWTARTLGTQSWITLSPPGGTLDPRASVTVTVYIYNANSLTPNTYTDTVTFTNKTNGSGNTTRPVNLMVIPPGELSATPSGGPTWQTTAGEPSSANIVYTLKNPGGTPIEWTASKAQSWITLSAMGGTLAPAQTATVAVSLNSNATALPEAYYTDTVILTNTTNGNGNTTRPIVLFVYPRQGMSVTPLTGLISTGEPGGPFNPAKIIYFIQVKGQYQTGFAWRALSNQSWISIEPSGGTIGAAQELVWVTVYINSLANSLPQGDYVGTVTFKNTRPWTDASDTTTRTIRLTVGPLPGLSVTPNSGLSYEGPAAGAPGKSIVYTLKNMDSAPISWAAETPQTWITISPSTGTLAPGASVTVTVSFNIDVNALNSGYAYAGQVVFRNMTNGRGDTQHGVTLWLK